MAQRPSSNGINGFGDALEAARYITNSRKAWALFDPRMSREQGRYSVGVGPMTFARGKSWAEAIEALEKFRDGLKAKAAEEAKAAAAPAPSEVTNATP
jgi:hypothetical protein